MGDARQPDTPYRCRRSAGVRTAAGRPRRPSRYRPSPAAGRHRPCWPPVRTCTSTTDPGRGSRTSRWPRARTGIGSRSRSGGFPTCCPRPSRLTALRLSTRNRRSLAVARCPLMRTSEPMGSTPDARLARTLAARLAADRRHCRRTRQHSVTPTPYRPVDATEAPGFADPARRETCHRAAQRGGTLRGAHQAAGIGPRRCDPKSAGRSSRPARPRIAGQAGGAPAPPLSRHGNRSRRSQLTDPERRPRTWPARR